MPKIGKWSRTLDVNDGATAYTVNQRGAGGIVDFQAGGVSKFSVTATAIVCGLPITGGDQAWADVGDLTFHAGSILKSGGTNGNTLLIAANDTTFITLTTGTTDSCTIASPTITTPIIASLYQAAGGGLLSVPASVGVDTFCLLGAQQELDNKTLDASVAKGTWTASGTWTIPAVTLGGAVSGGGQALNAIGSIVFNATAATITTVATDGATFLLVAKNTAAQTQIVASVTGNATIASSTFDILVTPRFKAQAHTNYMTFTKAADVASRTVTFQDASGTVPLLGIANAWGVAQTIPGITLSGDLVTDRWISSLTNTLIGSGVVGVGALSHVAGNTGWYNSGFGMNSLYAITTGYSNAAFGANSLYTITTGYDNAAFGTSSLLVNTTGYQNTAIGSGALYAITTGNGNIALGFCAGFYETGSNKLFIDNATRASEADGRIKALIYGIFASTVAAQSLRINGKVGIDYVPTAWLHLPAGAAGANLAPLKLTSGTLLTTAEAGAVEFLTDDFYATITTDAARKKLLLGNGINFGPGGVTSITVVDGQITAIS